MKKAGLIAVAAFMAVSAAPAKADWFFGVYAEGQYWAPEATGSYGTQNNQLEYDLEDEGQMQLAVALHHPIPLIPNIRLERQEMETTGFRSGADSATANQHTVDLQHDTVTLYYRLLDNQLARIHFGVSAKRFDGYVGETFSGNGYVVDETIPTGYLMGSVGLPFSGLSVYGRGHLLAFDDNKVQDIEAGVQYRLFNTALLDGSIQVGYRAFNLELDNVAGLYTDFEFKGPFVGFQLHF